MKKSIITHQRAIVYHSNAIEKIQTKCKHLHKTEKAGGNTGNWDPLDDRYWTDYKCLDCDKSWTVNY